jgi:MraZ protein
VSETAASFHFRGFSQHTIDDKGRIAIPKNLRKAIPPESGEKFTLNIGHDKTIEIYPLSTRERLERATITTLDRDVRRDRKKMEAIFWPTNDQEMDQTHRILIPKFMLEWLGLKPNSECALAGMGDYFILMGVPEFKRRLDEYLQHYDEYTDKDEPGDRTAPAPDSHTGVPERTPNSDTGVRERTPNSEAGVHERTQEEKPNTDGGRR